MVEELLSKWKKEEVYVQQVVIAMLLAELTDEEVRKAIYTLNELVVQDIPAILKIISNVRIAKNTWLRLGQLKESNTILEFFGMSPDVASILAIDDAYLEYAKTLSPHLQLYFSKVLG